MRQHVKTWVGITLSVLLLVWTMRDVSPAVVLHEMSRADPLLFGLSLLVSMTLFVLRAVRWGVYLAPLGRPVPFRPRFAAVMIGFAANNLLPARVGEFARAVALARTTPVSTATAFATLVVERLFDALVLLGFLFGAMASRSFPLRSQVAGVDPRDAAALVAGGMLGVGAVLLLMVVAPARATRAAEALVGRLLPRRFRGPVLGAFASFLHGLAVLRSGRLFVGSLVLAALQWLLGAWSVLLGFRAFGIHEVSLVGAVFLQSIIALAVAIPSSPGFFGPFEAAARAGLSLWDVPADKAVSFAVGIHIGGFIPVTLIGIYYVWRLNLRWTEVKHSDEVVEETAADPPGAASGGA